MARKGVSMWRRCLAPVLLHRVGVVDKLLQPEPVRGGPQVAEERVVVAYPGVPLLHRRRVQPCSHAYSTMWARGEHMAQVGGVG